MKNKLIISLLLISNISFADYTAKIYLDNNSFKFKNNNIQPPVNFGCIFDTNNMSVGVLNISKPPEEAEGFKYR